jgi:hypothetical protein
MGPKFIGHVYPPKLTVMCKFYPTFHNPTQNSESNNPHSLTFIVTYIQLTENMDCFNQCFDRLALQSHSLLFIRSGFKGYEHGLKTS